jgi:autotransporter-associated beta strand protein
MGQLTTSAFTTYNAANAGSIAAGPFALYTVSLDSLLPTQINEGYAEVNYKTAGFDDLTSSAAVEADLLGYIEPVVIGPGGALYLLDGHHTLTAVANSMWGASNPTVYVNVVANYSNLTTSQFWTMMQANNLVLPLNNGVSETIDPATGAPIPTSLTALISDPYRGLEYSILKNKNSVLFTSTSNIAGAVGSAIPGLDKMTGFYSDFIWAQAYQDALGGLGLPYLSPGDIQLSTQWNLNLNNTTVEPLVGAVKVGQLPGAVLQQNIAIASTISNATLATGTLDAFGTFTGITSFTFGGTTLGIAQSGLVIQLGADNGKTITLTGSNSYTGGTTLTAGSLIIGSDAALGAAAPASYTINPASIVASVEAANGIIFNSLTEGNASLTIGTAAGGGTATFTTNRPIAVDGEIATLNPDGYLVTLTGQIVSVGSDGTGIGNTTGVSDFTVNDTSTGAKGVVTIAPATGSNSLFYGNWIITAGTLSVASDAALGNTTLAAADLGQIELNGGTFQTSGSFASNRALFLAGGSTFDTDGQTTSWGALNDTQRTLTVINSSTTSAGAVTFNAFDAAATATLALTPGTKGVTVTLTNGFVRSGAATVLIQPGTGNTLGSATEKLLATNAPTLIDGIVSPWIISDNGAAATLNPYNFMTYGANGFVTATYSKTGGGTTGGLAVAGSSDVVDQTSSATLAANTQVYALNITNGVTVSLGTHTLTLGDGTDPAGLILQNAAISGGTLAFGGSEGVIWLKGSTGQIISSVISGSGGLTLAGSGGVTLNTVSTETGAINVDSGTLTLGVANVFAGDAAGVTLADVKSKPSNAILAFSTSQSFASLNSAGNNSAITMSGGAALTIGDSNNESSTLSSGITETGAAVASGALVKAGTGLLDLSGMSKNTLTLVAGSTIAVQAGQLRIVAKSVTNANTITVASGAELQFEESGGDVFAGAITGAGDVRLLSGILKLTGTANTYSGGTFVEIGSTLDLTTANVSSGNANIGDAGGTVDFDQNTNGTYSGVISDARLLGFGPLESASLIKDDSTTDNAGVVKLTQVQGFSGYAYIEAGGIELGAANALATSAGVVLGRIGGGATASLTLDANQTLASLSSDAGNTTTVVLNGNVLTLDPSTGAASSFGGVISDGSGPGRLVIAGAGLVTLTGANTYSGGTTLQAGTLELGNNAAEGTGAITFASGDTATLKLDSGIAITNTVAGFASGDTIDLAGLGWSASGGATLGPGNLLTVSEGGKTEAIQLATGTSYAGNVFHLGSDGNGGVDVTLTAAPTLTVNNGNGYVNAAGESSVAFAVAGLVTGDTGTVTFTDSLGNTVAVAVTAGQTAYSANFTGLVDGTITASLALAGESYSETGNAATLKTTTPATPSAADAAVTNGYVNAASDLATQALTGTGTAGDTVTVYDGTTALGTTTVAGNGSWSYTLGVLANGSHSLTATQTDVAGNTSAASAAIGFVVATTLPAAPAALTDPASSNGVVNAVADTSAQALTGTGTAGDTITVYDGTTQLGTTTVGANGSWSYTLGALANGSHSLTATQSDPAGNVGAASGALVLNVDTTVPAAPAGLTDSAAVAGVVNLASDTGAQALTGTGTAGDTITVYDGGVELGTTVAGTTGAWSFTLGTLANGSHSLTATDTSAVGNVSSASGALTLTVDSVNPAAPGSLADAGATNGVVNAANDTQGQTLTGTGVAGDTITVYDNGVQSGTTTVAGDGTWSFGLGVLADGAQTLTATQTKPDGNVSTAATLALTVDTVIPAAPAGLADTVIVNGYVDIARDTAAQVLTGTGTAGDTITVYNGTTALGTTTVGSTGAWSFALGALAGGTKVLTATQTSPDGNTSAASTALDFIVDLTVPPAPYALADASATKGYVGAAHDTAAQALTGRTTAGDVVTIYDNGVELGTATANSLGVWSFTLGVLANGVHSLTATNTNAVGNVSAASAALALTVETVAPAAPAGLADAGDIGGHVPLSADKANQALTGTAAAGETITVYDNGVKLGTTTTSSAGTWSYKLGALALNSTNSLTATATDAAGNVSAQSTTLTFEVISAFPTVPARLADSDDKRGFVDAANDLSTQTLTGTGLSGDTITIYDNGTALGTTTVGSAGTWSYALGTLANGSYALTATAGDSYGDVSAASTALAFVVDTTIPTPVLTGETVTGGSTITLTGTDAEPGATISIKDSAAATASTTTAASDGSWSETLTLVAATRNTFTVTGSNAAGNKGTAASTVVIDTLAGASFSVGAGPALVFGQPGQKMMTGTGPDTFVFHAGFGNETISGFATSGAAADVLQFDKSEFADWAHLLGATTQVGTSLEITLDANDILTLKNVTAASFTSANVHFV